MGLQGENSHGVNEYKDNSQFCLDFLENQGYHLHRSTDDGGESMTTRDVLNTALGRAKMTQNGLAELVDIAPQRLSYKMVNNSVKADDLIRMLDVLGYEIALKSKETGETFDVNQFRAGHGRHLRKMSDKVTYDTKLSGALSNSFYADGEHEYGDDGSAEELYLDREGRYFIAEYHDDPSLDRIQSVSPNVAKAFIEKYGTEIEKTPQ